MVFVASSEWELLKAPEGKTIAFFGNWKQPESHSLVRFPAHKKLASVWVGSIAVKGSEDEKG